MRLPHPKEVFTFEPKLEPWVSGLVFNPFSPPCGAVFFPSHLAWTVLGVGFRLTHSLTRAWQVTSELGLRVCTRAAPVVRVVGLSRFIGE